MIKDFSGQEHQLLDASGQEIALGVAWLLYNAGNRQFNATRVEIVDYYLGNIGYKEHNGKKRTTKYGRKFIMIKEDTNGNNKG